LTTIPITIQGENAFDQMLDAHDVGPLRGADLDTVQVNIGLKCNLACHHCHVESSPSRTEEMDWPTMQHVLRAAREANAKTLDITGGAPEMHPHFRAFVAAGREQGLDVIVRTNLTILLEAGYEDMPEFFAQHRVRLVASLPCYLEENVDKQRGKHVYQDSVEALKLLNAVGYGVADDLVLDLIYNPVGASLPPAQVDLEADYHRELDARFGIRFHHLLTITNMPIGRFLHDLRREGKADAYWRKLHDAFNPAAVEPLMCRHQIHVAHDGTLHDCDFNYALGMPVSGDHPQHIRDFDAAALRARRIATADHCFGCAAGAGSSCGGSLT